MSNNITQAQLDAIYSIYQRWQDKTPHAIMPTNFKVIPDDEYRDGDYVGVWVGGEPGYGNGGMYLGIEKDGYTHS